MEFEEENEVLAAHDDIDEDIKLLKTALQDGEENDGSESDGELQILEQNDDEYVSVASASRPSTSTDYTVSSFPTTSMGTDADDLVYRIDQSSINPETCLAMNRAYQEVLLDTLRQIEMSLSENRLKQRQLSEGLDEKFKDKKPVEEDAPKPHKFVLNTPFFNDGDDHPPFNSDVQEKISMNEEKQQVKPKAGWPKRSRKKLLSAIQTDALDQLLRPVLNRLEVESSKLVNCKNNEEIAATNAKIEKLRNEIKRKQRTPADELLKGTDTNKIDFMKISVVTFDGKYSPQECEGFWRNVLHPSINKDEWTKEENDRLTELVKKNNLRNWKSVAEELGTNRTPFQCLQHFQINSIVHDMSEWRPEEDELLMEVVETCKYGTGKVQWSQVSYYVDMRSATQCMNRWRKINPQARHGRWSSKEDSLLTSAVQNYGVVDWCRISECVPGRTSIQCRDRYLNSIYVSKNQWTYDDDKKLLQLYNQYNNFTSVALYMKTRTEGDIEGRYKLLKEWETEWNKFCKLSRAVQRSQLSLSFVITTEGELISRLSLPFWVEKEEKSGKNMQVIEKEQREFAKYFRKTNKLSEIEDGEWRVFAAHNQIRMEDYLKQAQDRLNGDLIVPRPPPVKKLTSVSKVARERNKLIKLLERGIESSLNKITCREGDQYSIMASLSDAISHLFDAKSRRKFAEEKADELISKIGVQNHFHRRNSVKNILKALRGEVDSAVLRVKKRKKQESAKAPPRTETTATTTTSGAKRGRKKMVKRPPLKKQPWEESTSEEELEEETESEEEKEEDSEEDGSEEEEYTPRVKKPLTAAQIRGKGKLAQHKQAMDMIRDAIRARPLLSQKPLGRRRTFKMYPQSVIDKCKSMGEEEESKQQKKCLALLMKSFDVDTNEVFKNAREAKKQNSARAMLMFAKPSSRRLTSCQGDNEEIENAELVLELKQEIGQGETNENVENSEDDQNESEPEKTKAADASDPSDEDGNKDNSKTESKDKLYEEYNKGLPYIPPNLTNLRSMKSLLLEHRCHVDKAGVYFNRKELKEKLYSMRTKGPNLLMNVLRGAGGTKANKRWDEKLLKPVHSSTDLALEDVVKHVRKTKPYQQLKARFQAAFCWPALMSTIQPPNQDSEVPDYILNIREGIKRTRSMKNEKKAKVTTYDDLLMKLPTGPTAVIPEKSKMGTSTSQNGGASADKNSSEGEEDDGEQEEDVKKEDKILEETIKHVLLMSSAKNFLESGDDEETINQLVEKIRNVHKERNQGKKKRRIKPGKYRKKMSPAMASAVEYREKIKILRKLNLFDKYMQIQKTKKLVKKEKEEETPSQVVDPRLRRRSGRPVGSKSTCYMAPTENARRSSRQEMLRAKAQQLEVYEQCGYSPEKKPRYEFKSDPDDPYIYNMDEIKALQKQRKPEKKKLKSGKTIKNAKGTNTFFVAQDAAFDDKSSLAEEVPANNVVVIVENPPEVKRKIYTAAERKRMDMNANKQNKLDTNKQNKLDTSSGQSDNVLTAKRKRTSDQDTVVKKLKTTETQSSPVEASLASNNVSKSVSANTSPEINMTAHKNIESGTHHFDIDSKTGSPSPKKTISSTQPVKVTHSPSSSKSQTSTSSVVKKVSVCVENSTQSGKTIQDNDSSHFERVSPSFSKQQTGTSSQGMKVPVCMGNVAQSIKTVQTDNETVQTGGIASFTKENSNIIIGTDHSEDVLLDVEGNKQSTDNKSVTVQSPLTIGNNPTVDTSGDTVQTAKDVTPVMVGVPVYIGGVKQTAWLPILPGKDGMVMKDADGNIIIPKSMTFSKPTEDNK